MKMLCKELESMERQGKAPAIKQRNSVVGVICIRFNPDVRKHEDMDPEEGFPAMLLSLGSLMVVAASWPRMPRRACHSCLEAYMTDAKMAWLSEASTGAGQPDGVVVSGNCYDLARLHIHRLAEKRSAKPSSTDPMPPFWRGGWPLRTLRSCRVASQALQH